MLTTLSFGDEAPFIASTMTKARSRMSLKQEILLCVAAAILASILYAGMTGWLEVFDDAVVEMIQ